MAVKNNYGFEVEPKGTLLVLGVDSKGTLELPKGTVPYPWYEGTHSHTTYSCIFIGSHLKQELQDVNTGLFSGNVHRCQP